MPEPETFFRAPWSISVGAATGIGPSRVQPSFVNFWVAYCIIQYQLGSEHQIIKYATVAEVYRQLIVINNNRRAG